MITREDAAEWVEATLKASGFMVSGLVAALVVALIGLGLALLQ